MHTDIRRERLGQIHAGRHLPISHHQQPVHPGWKKNSHPTAGSKAILRFGTGIAHVSDGAWTGPRPRMAIYDTTFINDNVCSGDMVSAEHLKKQFGLVVGEKGVQLVRRLVELEGENRDNNNAIATTQAELNGIHRSIAPAMTLDAFLALAPDQMLIRQSPI